MNCSEFVYMFLDKDKCLWSKNVKCHTHVKGKEKISHFKMLAVKGQKGSCNSQLSTVPSLNGMETQTAVIAIASIIHVVLGTNGKTLIRLLIRNQAHFDRKLLVPIIKSFLTGASPVVYCKRTRDWSSFQTTRHTEICRH